MRRERQRKRRIEEIVEGEKTERKENRGVNRERQKERRMKRE